MLAVQMVGNHEAAMEMLTKAKRAETTDQLERYSTPRPSCRATYTSQLEALSKHCRGGAQKVTVEHVHVYQGGQAIVGNVTTPGACPRQGGIASKPDINPMNSLDRQPSPFRVTPRCCAQTRAGTPCLSPALRGKIQCHKHGGAKGSGAPKGSQKGRYRHGLRTQTAMAEVRRVRDVIAE